MKKHFNPPLLPERKAEEEKVLPVMSLEEVRKKIEDECGSALYFETYSGGAHKVIVLPEAMQEFINMVNYGRRSPMNRKEQKYNGYGHFLHDENGNIIIIVSHFIQVFTINRSAVHASNLGPDGEPNAGLDFLQYYREEFLECESEYNTDAYGFTVDPFLDICGPSRFVLEGHTHPDLGVFYSSTDKMTGAARTATAPVCIFVCDPVRKDILGSVGRNFESAEVILYGRKMVSAAGLQEMIPVIQGADTGTDIYTGTGADTSTDIYTGTGADTDAEAEAESSDTEAEASDTENRIQETVSAQASTEGQIQVTALAQADTEGQIQETAPAQADTEGQIQKTAPAQADIECQTQDTAPALPTPEADLPVTASPENAGNPRTPAKAAVCTRSGTSSENLPQKTQGHPTDEIVCLAQQCFSLYGYSGKIKCRTGMLGKMKINIKIVVPKDKRYSCTQNNG